MGEVSGGIYRDGEEGFKYQVSKFILVKSTINYLF